MKRKNERLDPIQSITKSEASYEKLMLQMMSKLVSQTKLNNSLISQHFGKGSKPVMNSTFAEKFKQNTNLPLKVAREDWEQVELSPGKKPEGVKVQDVYESRSGSNIRPHLKNSNSRSTLKGREREVDTPDGQSNNEDKMLGNVLQSIEKRLQSSDETNKKMLALLQQIHLDRQRERRQESKRIISEKNIKEDKKEELGMIERALGDKLKSNMFGPNPQDTKNSYGILTEILPYSDRRQIKVKFRIPEIVNISEESKLEELKVQTAEWLGMVYRATASICWNMLLNNYLSFQEVKILFTENIIFNFIEFMKQMKKRGQRQQLDDITSIINQKSVNVLEFLCRQYPQTKIEAPNLALRSILPQIDNQGRSKYDLVWKSDLAFTFRQNGDYTDQIMRMINFMISKSNEQYDGFFGFMKNTFQEIFLPIHKRRKLEDGKNDTEERQIDHEDLKYREKVKGYTKYLIGRKIPKNTLPYTDEQIDDGIFFVKSNAVLRIITKWVEDLKEYFENPEKRIKNNYNENKDHHGNIMYLSALLKNGIHKKILEEKDELFAKINKIRTECQKMEYLLTEEDYTTDPSQVHLSEEQISVGMYSVNIKRVISSYICSELNKLIHFLLKIPKDIPEDTLGNESDVFQSQARKDLDAVNLITFKLFDLLRCKIHSNEEEIIWIVNYLIHQSKNNRNKFKIVRIKDRLGMGTRDIMINGQVNRGIVCQIQLSVTSNSDRKQELLDSYNHFLYELKRSELGPITENVSIWSNLEQRYSYFQQLMTKRNKNTVFVRKQKPEKHKCRNSEYEFRSFKRPLLCHQCKIFFPIPRTCLLNVICTSCSTTLCGQCYYYNYLNADQRKEFIFDKNRIIKYDVMDKLEEYTDYTKPFPTTGFFIKKDFLTKQMSFYMAIEKNKQDDVKSAPEIDILVIQTIIRNGHIFNRQVNKKQIKAELVEGVFYIKNYAKTQLNNFIIFSFKDGDSYKKRMKLDDLKKELEKPQNSKAKVLNILREPSYIHNLRLLKRQNEKIKELNSLQCVVKDSKIVVYVFKNYYLLAQVLVKGKQLRADIRKKINLNELKSFAERQTDIVSMEYKYMTGEMDEIYDKFKPKLYDTFCKNLRKLFLSNGDIESIKCFKNFVNLETVFISQNKLTSLEGVEDLKFLMSFTFDHNQIESLEPLSKIQSLRYISGNSNKITSLKGLKNLHQLRSLSIYENDIDSLEQIRGSPNLDSLYVRQNPITDLSVVQSFKKLHKLYMGKTKVSNIPDLSMLSDLKVLSMEGLGLTSVPTVFSNLQLHELSLANNSIEKITDINNQTQLTYLSLSNNKITKIENISNLDKLQTLKLNKNKITVIEGIRNLDSINYINLKYNPIDDLAELVNYEISFTYVITHETLTEKAKKQLADFETTKSNISSSQD